jgi:hypothetical protein
MLEIHHLKISVILFTHELSIGKTVSYSSGTRECRGTDYFSGPPTKTMTRRWEMLNRSQMETYTDIIYGKKPIEAFDEFVENWYSSGGEDITKEVNEWYGSVR